MHRLQPRHIILPSIFLSAFLIFSFSRSVYGFAKIEQQEQDVQLLIQTNEMAIHENYPADIQHWNAEIINASSLYGVDPNLIAAVMLMESGGQPEVLSSSGAVGLMQIMPRDGVAASFSCVNGPCFKNRPSINQLINPQFNIDYGTKMLSKLINSTGSIRSALYAYGPMDVGYSYADNVLAIYGSY